MTATATDTLSVSSMSRLQQIAKDLGMPVSTFFVKRDDATHEEDCAQLMSAFEKITSAERRRAVIDFATMSGDESTD